MARSLDVFGTEDPEGLPSDDILRDLGAQAQIEALTEWFEYNFEDPAENTPYESAEGGYQYVWGGPYDARDQLGDRFPFISEDVLEAAVSELEIAGGEWAPNSRRVRELEDDEEQGYLGPTNDSEWREHVTNQLDTLQATLDVLVQSQRSGIGHNRPPEPIELIGDEPLTTAEQQSVQAAINETRVDLTKLEPPDAVKIRERSSLFRRLASKLAAWISKRANTAVDAGIKVGVEYTIKNPEFLLNSLSSTAHTFFEWASFLHLPF